MLSKIPRLGFGTWQLDQNIKEVLTQAVQCGYKHFDCAEIYQNQKPIGAAFKELFNTNKVKREDIWITSKVWNSAHRKEDVLKSCNQTIQDLQCDYLDLLLIHWPFASSNGGTKLERIPLSETWSAMEDLVQKNLVKHIGVSNFDIQLLNDLLSYCNIKPYTNQVECHPLLQQKTLLEYCTNEGIILTCYSPLVRLGSEKSKEYLKSNEMSVLESIAKAHNKTVAQVMLKWGLQRSPNTVLIPKTKNLNRVKENIDLNFELKSQEMEKINNMESCRRLILTPGPINVFY